LTNFPDRKVGFLAFSPTIIVNMDDLEKMQVIQTGSRVTYRQLFSGTDNNIISFIDSLETLDEEELMILVISWVELSIDQHVFLIWPDCSLF
jgi:predicted lysophospholipase L1 biosynthesis ABC-type transport system permease subunit